MIKHCLSYTNQSFLFVIIDKLFYFQKYKNVPNIGTLLQLTVDSTISIRGGNLSWATTRRLLKGMMVLIPKPSDGLRVIKDNRGNRPNKMIEINEREDIKLIGLYLCGF